MAGKLKLTFDNKNLFTFSCALEERSIPEAAGFLFAGIWYTKNPRIAARLREFADAKAKNEIDRILIKVSPWTGAIPVPPGMALKPFQPKIVKFALSRNRAYIAADPGLGKGVMAVAIMNALHHGLNAQKICKETLKPIFDTPIGVYICPPFLTRTVEEEFNKWKTFSGQVTRHDQFFLFGPMVIIPDSLLARDEMRDEIEWFCRYAKQEGRETVLFIDEAHRYGNEEAQRTESLLLDVPVKNNSPLRRGVVSHFDRVYYLSGSPIDGKPIKLFPILNRSAPETIGFRTRIEYGTHFCEGYEESKLVGGVEKKQWVFNGASNMDELEESIKGTFMYRVRKEEVADDLPKRLEELLIVDYDLKRGTALDLDRELLRLYSPKDLMHGKLLEKLGKDDDDSIHLATYKRLLGQEKVPFMNTFTRDLMTETNSSLLLFAHHRDVLEALATTLSMFKPLLILGGMKSGAAFEVAAKFQKDKNRRLVLLQDDAGGMGLTLTKADRVLLGEPSWSRETNKQCIDRAHRIGQKNSVFAQLLCFRNSMDKRVIEANIRKEEISSYI